MDIFTWPVRVYYEDTDAGGVVFYANYLKFMERARTEWLRNLGVEQDQLRERDGLLFIVSKVDLDYRKSARFNDLLEVTVGVEEQTKAAWLFSQKIYREEEGKRVELCRGHTKVVCIDAETFRPKAIPEYITTEISSDN